MGGRRGAGSGRDAGTGGRPSLDDYRDDEEDDSAGPAPIGVPRDYVIPRQGARMGSADASERWADVQYDVKPRYWTGDQWTTVRSLRPEDRASLQLVLKQMGLIPQGTSVVLGAWDDPSASGFREVLAWANTNGVTWQQALEQMLVSRDQFGDLEASGEELPAFTAEVANPEDIKRAFREGMKSRLGVGQVEEDRLERAVAAYQRQQIDAQRSQYNAQTGGGGTVTAPMDFETFADIEAKKADPTAYDSRKVVGAADYFVKKLRGEV